MGKNKRLIMPNNAVGKYRWTVVALLFFATSINYIDRQVIGLLKPTLAAAFKWTETDYSHIVMAFTASYAVGLLVFGRLIDKLGTKLGYTVSIIIWSAAAMLHAAAKSTAGFVAARIGLGLGEAGNFPAAIKTVAEWFPKKERALATGIFNSGANIGAVIAPIMVPWILGSYGWQEAFIITGALAFIWLVFWVIYYEIPAKQKKVSRDELAYINSDADEQLMVNDAVAKPTSYSKLFGLRQTWAFVLGKFFTDPVWYFLLFWLPDYFHGTFHLSLTKPGWPLAIVYTATTVGSIGGGYLSSYFIKRGWTVNKARKTTMLIIAFIILPIAAARFATNISIIVTLISLAAAGHQAWSANIFTLVSDMFPKKDISSVVGIGSMAGSVGGIFFPMLIGYLLDAAAANGNKTVGYNFIFILCGVAYLLAWIIIQLLVPKLQKANVD